VKKPFAEMSYAEWREIMDVTLDGTIIASRPACRRCGNPEPGRSSISVG